MAAWWRAVGPARSDQTRAKRRLRVALPRRPAISIFLGLGLGGPVLAAPYRERRPRSGRPSNHHGLPGRARAIEIFTLYP
jgi:hypothetical protein